MTENEDVAVEENNDIPEPELPVLPLFGKWNLTEVEVTDTTLTQYINLNMQELPEIL